MIDSKTCENPACGQAFERGHRSRAQFALRRYCGRACSIVMRSAHRAVRPKPEPVVSTSHREPWRPNAPGWPKTPNIRTAR